MQKEKPDNPAFICLLRHKAVKPVCRLILFEQLKIQTQTVQDENEEYQRLFDDDDINAYKEKLAIENMNYAYPNEIRFYDTSRN